MRSGAAARGVLVAATGFFLAAGACGGRSVSHEGAGGADDGATGAVGNRSSSSTGGGDVGGGTGASSAGGTSIAGARGDAHAFPCVSEVTWRSTLSACDDSFVHRPEALPCPPPSHDASGEGAPDEGQGRKGPGTSCHQDADCFSGEYCMNGGTGGGCVPLCITDSDCKPGTICVCAQYKRKLDDEYVVGGRCIEAECTTDADCDGSFCSSPLDVGNGCGRGPSYFACQTRRDECGGRADCPDGMNCYALPPRRCGSPASCKR